MSDWYDQLQSDITEIAISFDRGQIDKAEAMRRLWLLGMDPADALEELYGAQDEAAQ